MTKDLQREYALVRSTLAGWTCRISTNFLQAWPERSQNGAQEAPRARKRLIGASRMMAGVLQIATARKTLLQARSKARPSPIVRRKSHRNFDEAELLEVHEASPDRIEAKCEAFGRCGGCSLQHVSEQQRDIKAQTLRDNLERIGRVAPRPGSRPMTGPVWNYRRRARLAVKDVYAKGRTLVGFRERHAPYITDMNRCEVLAAPVDSMIARSQRTDWGLSIRRACRRSKSPSRKMHTIGVSCSRRADRCG